MPLGPSGSIMSGMAQTRVPGFSVRSVFGP